MLSSALRLVKKVKYIQGLLRLLRCYYQTQSSVCLFRYFTVPFLGLTWLQLGPGAGCELLGLSNLSCEDSSEPGPAPAPSFGASTLSPRRKSGLLTSPSSALRLGMGECYCWAKGWVGLLILGTWTEIGPPHLAMLSRTWKYAEALWVCCDVCAIHVPHAHAHERRFHLLYCNKKTELVCR